MKYFLATIAGLWMVEGLSLLIAPRYVITTVRDWLALSPALLRWEAIPVCLGALLILVPQDLHYQPLWLVAGLAMMTKGAFLMAGPESWRRRTLDWCLTREDIDYRFWGLGLCTLALLLLHALGWAGTY
ncbi:MAG: hypothetical protein ACT4OO_05395 [Nitrospiraceae bacterium]